MVGVFPIRHYCTTGFSASITIPKPELSGSCLHFQYLGTTHKEKLLHSTL
ncbi:hypothetical protein PORCRE_1781 [Porphyromonas crevioricanis JCM 15906]|uniref:Uncharacterized protein n=1 Tax=Porphyromonas crevioricanis JCM 15906 TaxID=1305617 RepID=T1CIR1_9PORP|nr:hypothetical protein PORCRE_1781 [Porphyromonas crevioricanis JCM 15906]